MPSLNPKTIFDLPRPRTRKNELVKQIENLEENSKQSLTFWYSEFLLRSLKVPGYKKALENADFTAVDGQGILWSLIRQDRFWLFASFYKFLSSFLRPMGQIFYWPLLILQLISHTFSVFYLLVFRRNLSELSGTDLILGRDFVYSLLETANLKEWKLTVIGASFLSKSEFLANIQNKYPDLALDAYLYSPDSNLMRDQTEINKQGISSENLTDYFPELEPGIDYLRQNPADIILVCLGGISGKQEIFLERIKNERDLNFRLASGVGAALDHLGAGKKQKRVPIWVERKEAWNRLLESLLSRTEPLEF